MNYRNYSLQDRTTPFLPDGGVRLVLTELMLLILFFCFSLPTSTTMAQQGSSTIQRKPTYSAASVLEQIQDLRHQPLSSDYDSLKAAYQTVQAYLEWAYRKPVYHWSLPRVKRVNHAEHRAEAELMAGVLNGALLQRHISMGSGVLPILDASITHLDSARTYFDIIDEFTIANSSQRIETDNNFARQLGDSLRRLRDQVMQEQSFRVLQQYDAASLFYATLPEPEEEHGLPINSISYWVNSRAIRSNPY